MDSREGGRGTTNGGEGAGASGAAAKAKWSAYLRRKHGSFVDQLCERIRRGRKSSLRTLCGAIASTPAPVVLAKNGGGKGEEEARMIDERLVYRLIEALADPDGGGGRPDESMLRMTDAEFVRPHWDVSYFVLLAIKNVALDRYAETRRRGKEEEEESESLNKGKRGKRGREIEGGGEPNKDDGDDGAAADGTTIADNLARVLMTVQIPASETELRESDKNFLVPPPKWGAVGPEGDEDESGDDDDESEDGGGSAGDASEGESSSDSESDDDEVRLSTSNPRPMPLDRDAESKSRQKKKKKKPTGLIYQRLASHRRALSSAWLAVLKLPLSPPALRRVLQHLPAEVFPNIPHPLRYADVYADAYSAGGPTSIVALEGLFVLMTRHNLEYPRFYPSLYAIVTPQAFYAKHRSKFFRLVSKCLGGSQMLPGYVVAAFCKRLCRCALSAPPGGALFALALTSNLLRKHDECGCLVHRSGGDGGGGAGRRTIEDAFDPEENDPAECRALESSLWELDALSRHYHPAIATLAKSVGTEDETTPMHDVENEFSVHTYKSLFEQERKRAFGGGAAGGDKGKKKKRRKVALTFAEPRGLFSEDDIFGGTLRVPMTGEDSN